MSTTTISLPRPFIFTNAWPPSVLIGDLSASAYMAKRTAQRQSPLPVWAGIRPAAVL
jgi:hypothetical protein